MFAPEIKALLMIGGLIPGEECHRHRQRHRQRESLSCQATTRHPCLPGPGSDLGPTSNNALDLWAVMKAATGHP